MKKNIEKTNQYKKIEKVERLVKDIEPYHSVSDKEGEFLYNTARNCTGKGVIVEIGSWKGRSTIWLGRGSKAGNKVKIYAIDPHTGSPIHRKMYRRVWTFEEFKKNIKMANIENVVIPIVKTSEEAEKDWGSQPIEFLFIDGNHEYESVKLDFDKWFPYLIEEGIIAFHDTIFHSMTGPRKVVIGNLYKSKNFADINLINSITFAQKVSRNSLKDRLKNRYALLLRYLYEISFVVRQYLPRPIKKIGRKILKKRQ